MSLFLARRWRQQPQDLLTVDRGHTLSTGLCAAWHPAARQYIGPNAATFPPDGTYAYQADQSGGFGVKFNGAANSRIALPVGSAGFSASYSGTRLVLFRGFGNNLGLVSGTVAGTLGMRLNGGVNQIALVSASNVVVGIGNVPTSTAPTTALCTSSQDTNETRLHINGKLTFSGSSSYNSSNSGIWVGAITNHSSDANFFLALSWDRALSISEAAAIQENPWQIFKPKKTVFYSLPGNLFSALDEATSDRSDFIRSTVVGQVYETTLSPIQQTTGNINFVFDANSPLNAGGIKFDVLDGTNLVKSQTVTFPSSTSHFTITPSEYSSIGPSMFGRFVPQRWRQQPQGVLTVDLGHPLAAGLAVALTPRAFNIFDSNQTPITPVSVRNGPALAYTKQSDAVPTIFTLPKAISSSNWTLLQEVSCTPDPANFSATGGIHSSASERIHLHFKAYPSGNFGADARPYITDWNTTSGLPTSGRVILGATISSPATTISGYVNGSPTVFRTDITPSTINVNQVELFRKIYGGGGPDSMANGSTSSFFFVWTRPLSSSEMYAVSENPWQIFKPNPGRIYGMPPASVAFPWSPKLRITSL